MNFTLSTIARSLADHLAPHFPGVAFYEDPNQQDSRPPCLFLQQRYAHTRLRQAGRWQRRIGLELTYLLDYNLPNMQQLYQQAAETLDGALETFPYMDGVTDGAACLRTYEREWRVDPDALHYKFEIRVWVRGPAEGEPMRTMDYRQEVMDGR